MAKGCPEDAFEPGVEYDARLFLSAVEKKTFEHVYPKFNERKLQKDSKWHDVDPFGFYTPEENRAKRRDHFLFAYSPGLMPQNAEKPTPAQLSYKKLVGAQTFGAKIKLDDKYIKIIMPYTKNYEGDFKVCNFLEKLTTLGLQWAQVGGHSLYIYNGKILIGYYKLGLVSLAHRDIDKPAPQLKLPPKKEEKLSNKRPELAI